MNNKIATIKDTAPYKELLDKSWDYIDKMKVKALNLAVLRWHWGRDMMEVETKYGDATIHALAEDLDLHQSTLYRTLNLGKRFETDKALRKYWEECERAGIQMTLTRLWQRTLPDPTQRPDNYGGAVQVVDNLMHEIETLGAKVEKLQEFRNAPDIDDDKKREIVGVLAQAEEVIMQNSLKAKVGRSNDYLDYVRSLPCVMCGVSPSDPHHMDVGGTGMKGSDYSALPFCRKHHDEIRRGIGSFQQLHGINLYREVAKVLIRWCDVRGEDNEG